MSVCGQSGQTEEDSGSEEVTATAAAVRDIYKQKPASKVVRVLTVLAYLLSVSLAAILLSVYYVCVWRSPELPRANGTGSAELAARRAPGPPHDHPVTPRNHTVPSHDHPTPGDLHFTGGGDSGVKASMEPAPEDSTTDPTSPTGEDITTDPLESTTDNTFTESLNGTYYIDTNSTDVT